MNEFLKNLWKDIKTMNFRVLIGWGIALYFLFAISWIFRDGGGFIILMMGIFIFILATTLPKQKD